MNRSGLMSRLISTESKRFFTRSQMGVCTALAVCCLLISCVSSPDQPARWSGGVEDLLSPDEVIDGEEVQVTGWLLLESEATCLVRTAPGAGRNGLPMDSVSIVISEQQARKFKYLEGEKVVIRGIFRANILRNTAFLIGACRAEGVEVKSVEKAM
jgi:hypothetical protein